MQSSTGREARAGHKPAKVTQTLGIRQDTIEGRFRRITTHQLCLAWWLHQAGHMTRRQLRVYFAAHEMAERRRYTGRADRGRAARQPLFELAEIKTLVGGRGSATADAELAADVRALRRLGLVDIGPHAIDFAVSVDQIKVDDVRGFWALFEQVPNPARAVPVPRRTLRALAGGFSRGVTGVMLALMIRSLFWHSQQSDYRIDGRTKGSWIADVFGLSRRAVTDARAHLIGLGWLVPVEARQWELNRWGSRDRINVEWKESAVGEGGESASPGPENRAGFASPDLNQSASSTKNLKTRTLGRGPDQPGVYVGGILGKRKRPKGLPTLRNVETGHLDDTASLLALHEQAVTVGLIGGSEAGRLDFVALAERARTRGNNPAGLFMWLLINRRYEFITMADEDAAAQRLREWRNGRAERSHARVLDPAPRPKARALTDDDKLVQACLQVAEKRRIDPYLAARTVRTDWTRDQWEVAVLAYTAR